MANKRTYQSILDEYNTLPISEKFYLESAITSTNLVLCCKKNMLRFRGDLHDLKTGRKPSLASLISDVKITSEIEKFYNNYGWKRDFESIKREYNTLPVSEDFKLLSEQEHLEINGGYRTTNLILECKESKCRFTGNLNVLRRGSNPTIGAALNRSEYHIFRSKKVHGDKYGYTKTVYVNAKTKAIYECPEHGYFEQLPISHEKGNGCKRCAEIKVNNKRTYQSILQEYNTFPVSQQFTLLTEKQHLEINGYYSTNKLILECKKSKCRFKGILNILKRGSKPSIGAALNKTKYFIYLARQIHGDKYDYSKVKYVNNKSKVIIICKQHGEFKQSPNNHLQGDGCPECAREITGYANWKKNARQKAAAGKLSTIYLIECWDEKTKERFIKFGLTTNTVKGRYYKQNNPDTSIPYHYKMLHTINSLDIENLWKMEKELKSSIKELDVRYTPKLGFHPTECVPIFLKRNMLKIFTEFEHTYFNTQQAA